MEVAFRIIAVVSDSVSEFNLGLSDVVTSVDGHYVRAFGVCFGIIRVCVCVCDQWLSGEAPDPEHAQDPGLVVGLRFQPLLLGRDRILSIS